MIPIEQKAPPGDRTAAEWNHVAYATRRRRRILLCRILSYAARTMLAIYKEKWMRKSTPPAGSGWKSLKKPTQPVKVALIASVLQNSELFKLFLGKGFGDGGGPAVPHSPGTW